MTFLIVPCGNRATLKASESVPSAFTTEIILVHAYFGSPPGVVAGGGPGTCKPCLAPTFMQGY